jgi:hypothetical protein
MRAPISDIPKPKERVDKTGIKLFKQFNESVSHP